jgi:transcriptional regulator GlxA family with amidase domain
MAQMTISPPIRPRRGGPRRRRSISILAFDDCQLLDVTGPLQVFVSATELAAEHGYGGYDVERLSRTGGLVRTTSGLAFATSRLASSRKPGPYTLLLPGGRGVHAAAEDRDLLRWIVREASNAERVCSVCTGAFLLAATGLLDGRRAVTHWKFCERLARAYPQVHVECDPIFVRDGPCWSSAGIVAGIDLALALVEADAGRPLALATARHMVVFLKRPGGQAQFSTLLAAQAREPDRFAELHAWIGANLSADLAVPRLAERACMSERNFARVYTRAMGTSPARMEERMRVEAARRLLEEGPARLGEVRRAVGFRDEETLRRAFIRQMGIAPDAYRRGFSHGSRAPDAARVHAASAAGR